MTDTHAASGSILVEPEPVDWSQLLAQHDRWLRTVVYSRLGDPQAVDDVMQEVSLHAVRQAAPLSDLSKAGPWLYRLAVRQVLLHRRKWGRERKLLDGYARYRAEWDLDASGGAATAARPTDTPAPANDNPLAWLLADERRQLVRVALARLPRRDAQILLLKYSENWSYHQIAARLGISHSAVETRLHRARAKLREALNEFEVE